MNPCSVPKAIPANATTGPWCGSSCPCPGDQDLGEGQAVLVSFCQQFLPELNAVLPE
jgi:hypothetical protein